MKKPLFPAAAFITAFVMPQTIHAQTLAPVSAGGFNLDAVAEATTAALHTTGALDASDYVMYSAAYGTVYSTGTGLPNNGLISISTRSYQLQPYNQANVLFLTAGVSDSLVLTTPAAYAGLSLLAFATEGSGSINVTVRFTDNSTQFYSNQSLPDWFGTGNVVISGFDRCNRTSGTPNFQTSQPKMFFLDLPITCSNRSKSVSSVIIQNPGSNARICVMALSGAPMPVFSVSVDPVTCAGGKNGSASISPSGGLPPFSYTISTTPPQTNSTAINLVPGVYSYTAQDISACPVTGSFAVTLSLQPQPPLTVTANAATVCAGKAVTLTASGAASYTWSNSSSANPEVILPSATTLITVSGLTSQNCLRTGTILDHVNPLPAVTFTSGVSDVCITEGIFPLSGTPPGGAYSGKGTQGGMFNPAAAGTGTHAVTYVFTDVNGCIGSAAQSIAVHSLAAPAVTAATPVCQHSAPYQITVTPQGGVFSGQGVSANGMITTTLSGNFPFTYSIVSGPCSAATSGTFVIMPLPVVTLSITKTTYCLNGSVGLLQVSPAYGAASGNGLTGLQFNPTVAGVGSHTLSYTYTNTSKCVNSASLVVQVNDCTSLDETSATVLKVFPNPNNGEFSVESDLPEVYFLFDVLGKEILSVSLQPGIPQTIIVPHPYTGLFFLCNNNRTVVKKIVVR